MTKREYRGARSVDAFLGYIKEQMADTVQKLQTIYQVNEIDVRFFFFKKNHIYQSRRFNLYCLSSLKNQHF